ncbi:MAG: PAS domain-containing sensor histidine kinase [Intestinibacter sp.]|uniref:sensor histidine kinase n=1 Tax=Intestinibacter sp. TaxID=1965304 RepID=UPI002A7F6F8F|nr:PAS domain-containing sensor histidine kinase [Intestinibacter sp.]MDY4574929.1 PAS domain-containing sensor histidine kinase [Intestinibacter sp.]
MKFLNKYNDFVNFMIAYIMIICMFLIVLGDMDIYYMYLILVIINSSVGIFGFIISSVTLSTGEEKIYKDLAKIFGIVGINNLLFSMYVFNNLEYITLNQEVQIVLFNFAIQMVLYISLIHTYGNNKNIIPFKYILGIVVLSIPILYILVARLNILPKIFDQKEYSPAKNILCAVYILGYVYLLCNIKRLEGKFYNSKTVKNIGFILICTIGRILLMVFLGGINFFNGNINSSTNIEFINRFNCLSMTILNFIYVYMVYIICFRDIIKRPNQNLYYNLLKEKDKLQKNIEKLKEVSFNMEYYKIIYEELLRNMPAGILISSDNKIMFVNKKVLNLFKLKSENSIINKNILDIIDENVKDKYIEDLKSLNLNQIDQNVIKTRFSYNNVTFEGSEIRFYENVRGRIFQVSIISNIEDKIKLENAEKQLELRDLMDKAKNEVLSNISHEFKTPVNVIYSTVQIQDINLKKGNYGKILEFNEIIRQNCNRLIRLINNFIDSTKLENNQLKVNLKCVNIVSIIEDITMSVINFAERQNIELIFDTEEEELYCEIDIECIERVMLNLLSNAIKYNKKNGTIDVIIKNDEEHIYVEVIDSGIGIPKEKIDKIFDRFERMKDNNAVIKEGSGIGLSIVKQLVKALNGEIEIESQIGKGTTVRLTFKKSGEVSEEIYDVSQDLEEKVKLELSDIS